MLTEFVRAGLGITIAVACVAGNVLAAGWRTDGSGMYPDASPPVTWTTENNVVWKTPLPKRSNSSPIILENRLFVCAEPTTLLCISLDDGKILWTRTNGYDAVTSPETRDKVEKARRLQKQVADLQNKIKKTPNDVKLYKQMSELCSGIVDSPENAEYFLLADRYTEPKTHADNGHSSATPAGDGKFVYTTTGLGTVACYDLEGNRIWIRLLQKPTHDWGHSASPLLVDGKLVVRIRDLYALDPRTGETLWQHESNPLWGSPVRARIGKTDVIVTPGGDIVRASDGKALTRELSGLEYCSPMIQDGVAYFIQHGGKAVKLPEDAAEDMKPEILWETKPHKDRYYASPVCDEEFIYAVTQKGLFSVIDRATGEIVYSKALKLGGTAYPSIALAGGNLYLGSDSGKTIVAKPGREYSGIATNMLESFRGSPVFVGERMYVRGLNNLYCIGK